MTTYTLTRDASQDVAIDSATKLHTAASKKLDLAELQLADRKRDEQALAQRLAGGDESITADDILKAKAESERASTLAEAARKAEASALRAIPQGDARLAETVAVAIREHGGYPASIVYGARGLEKLPSVKSAPVIHVQQTRGQEYHGGIMDGDVLVNVYGRNRMECSITKDELASIMKGAGIETVSHDGITGGLTATEDAANVWHSTYRLRIVRGWAQVPDVHAPKPAPGKPSVQDLPVERANRFTFAMQTDYDRTARVQVRNVHLDDDGSELMEVHFAVRVSPNQMDDRAVRYAQNYKRSLWAGHGLVIGCRALTDAEADRLAVASSATFSTGKTLRPALGVAVTVRRKPTQASTSADLDD